VNGRAGFRTCHKCHELKGREEFGVSCLGRLFRVCKSCTHINREKMRAPTAADCDVNSAVSRFLRLPKPPIRYEP
jgi:hypothetical protein